MNEKILVVDDDLEGLKLIGLMLQRRGYEVISAHSGEQALLKAQTQTPDLVILDLMIPDMDGYEICRRLRDNPQTAHLPIIMFTAKTLVGDKVAGFQAGADDYLTKPVHPAELASHVEALLERSETKETEGQPIPRARVIGVLGAKGGVGTSTLAVNLAAAARQFHLFDPAPDEPLEVALVDFHPGAGTVAPMLGQEAKADLGTFMALNPDSLDAQMIENQIIPHDSGLRYLPTPLRPAIDQVYLLAEHVETILDHLSPKMDYVFLDLGNILDEATHYAIARCDVLLLTIEPEPLCLTLAEALLKQLYATSSSLQDLRVVLVERNLSTSAYSQTQIESWLDQDLAGVIPFAPEEMRQSIVKGVPIIILEPESEIAGHFRYLCEQLLA